MVPAPIQAALKQAMNVEGVPASSFDDLPWIMAQAAEGKTGIPNQQGSSARGLFQLLKPQYGLYPRGEASLENPGEECRGGIRYIVGRYRTAAAARAFWEKHRWY